MTKEIVKVISGSGEENISFNLSRTSESVRIIIVYSGADKDEIKINCEVLHSAENTKSEIYLFGILDQESTKTAKLQIKFNRGAKNSVGIEHEDVMLLSDRAHNISLPIILCDEKNVSGSHGCSVGHLDESSLKYLMARGISKSATRKILINAKIMQALDKIEDEKLKADTRVLLEDICHVK